MFKQDVLFVLIIDMEEEWYWDNDDFFDCDFFLENVEKFFVFQVFCEMLGICFIYFVDYVVVSNNIGSIIF